MRAGPFWNGKMTSIRFAVHKEEGGDCVKVGDFVW